MTWRIIEGDALTVLRTLPKESVRCCVTSPPYWGLRDYGIEDQLGLEHTPEEYVSKLVDVFREVRRVLAGDGTLWLNLGDCYAGSTMSGGVGSGTLVGTQHGARKGGDLRLATVRDDGLKPKDLIGIPWRVAFALQADGWWLRSDIIWAKPNPMPESVKDRPTKSHEYVFLLAKAERYYYDAAAIAERGTGRIPGNKIPQRVDPSRNDGGKAGIFIAQQEPQTSRNKRSVWTIATEPFPEAHFATFPKALVEACILAGSAPGDTVLDPFAGSGTTGLVALRLGRSFIGIELNPNYCEMARNRIKNDAPLLNS